MESYDLSIKKLRIIARLIKKAKDERVPPLLYTSQSFPEPIYHPDFTHETLDIKGLEEKILLQSTLIDKLCKALNYCRNQLKTGSNETIVIDELKGLFKRKQNKVAHVLRKTLEELKVSKSEAEELRAATKILIIDQYRLADGLKRAIFQLRSNNQKESSNSTIEKKRIEEQASLHYKLLLDESHQKNNLLEARIKKDTETNARLKGSFEELLVGIKKDFEIQLSAKDNSFKNQHDTEALLQKEVYELKKQIALLKAHLEGILIDKKKIEQVLKGMREKETEPLETKLKELDILLQTKEDELIHIQKHLGRKIQEIAGLQDMLQEQEDKTLSSELSLKEILATIEGLKEQHLRNEGFLNEEISSQKELLEEKATEIDSLQQEIVRLQDVEEDFEKMKESISLLQQNLLRVK
ncbi:MAG: hypothetical protein NTY13_03550 [Chlamydiae bacterium]|nr:hypothetical protein [Chlamydiota bacterium]